MKKQASNLHFPKHQCTFFQWILQGLFSFTLVTITLTCYQGAKGRCVLKLQGLSHPHLEPGHPPNYYRDQEPLVRYNVSKLRRMSSPNIAERTAANSSALATSVFSFSIIGPPSPAHEAALSYCAHLASLSWTSSVQVRVKVTFLDSFGDADTLGDARATSGWFIDGYAYPVAMVKSMLHEDVNAHDFGDDYFDIIVRLNSLTNWYVGTDKQTPRDKYDLVTVCMHELYHGLMVSGGNIEVARDASNGAYRGRFLSDSFMWRFDTFLAVGTAEGDCAVSSYKGKPRQLGDALTSNNLWFRGQEGRVSRLYAPANFEDGSSLYHLSEGAYGDHGSRNDLMTPSMPMEYASHEVGPLMRQMQALMLDEREKGARICTKAVRPIKIAHAPVNSKGEGSSSKSPTPLLTPTQVPTITANPSPTKSRSPVPSVSRTPPSTPTPSRTPTPSLRRTPWPFTTHYGPTLSMSPAKLPPQHVATPSPTSTPSPTGTLWISPSRTRASNPSPTRSSGRPAAESRSPFPTRSTSSEDATQAPPRLFSPSASPSPSLSTNATKSIFDTVAACFPNSATVELESGAMVEISTLRVGDRVRTGPTSFSDVFMFTHKDREISMQFVMLQLDSNHYIELSEGHYISANGILKTAKSVCKGDSIWLSSGNMTTVRSIQRIERTGLHNPQTADGNIVVNGVIASTYTEVISPRVATGLLAPLRAVYSLSLWTLRHRRLTCC